MKFVAIQEIPGRKTNNNVSVFLEEFMAANLKFAEVEFKEGEYKKPSYARNVIYESIKRNGYPIRVTQRGDSIYLIRKDM